MLQIQTTNRVQDQQQRVHPDFLANEQAYFAFAGWYLLMTRRIRLFRCRA